MPRGLTLRLELNAAALVHRRVDSWAHAIDNETCETAFGTHLADLDTASLGIGRSVIFTLKWLDDARGENTDFEVRMIGA